MPEGQTHFGKTNKSLGNGSLGISFLLMDFIPSGERGNINGAVGGGCWGQDLLPWALVEDVGKLPWGVASGEAEMPQNAPFLPPGLDYLALVGSHPVISQNVPVFRGNTAGSGIPLAKGSEPQSEIPA